MAKSIVLVDYKIMNADASEDDTDADRYLIKIEETEDGFNMPEEVDLKSNYILLSEKW